MPISNVSGSNFTTLYSSQGNANPYVPVPPSNANVSGQNYTTLYSLGSGTAPVPIEAYGNANVESFLATGSDTGGNVVGNILSSGLISATGNIITDQYFIGTLLGNITGNFVVPGFNTQVIYNNNGNAAASSGLTFVAASNTLTSGGVVSAVGNVRGGNITTVGQVSATGNITTANYFLGNGAFLTGLPEQYGNANVSAYLASGTNTANIITAANIAGSYILGNGSQLSGLPVQYSNANVTTLLANFGSNVISTTGNITAGYFVGNGSTLTNLTAGNIVGTVANATYALNSNAATYATQAVNATQANYANIANSVAGANVSGTVANAAYAITANSATYTTYAVNTVQANYANIANSVAGANVSGTVANATYALNANSSSYANHANVADVANSVAGSNVTGVVPLAQYVTGNAQGNITSVGVLTSLSSTGNIDGANINGNGSGLSSLTGANVTGTVANATYALNANSSVYADHANVADVANSVAGGNVTGIVPLAEYVTGNAQGNITSVGILTDLSVSGNVDGGNLLTSGRVSAAGNITGLNIKTDGVFYNYKSAYGPPDNSFANVRVGLYGDLPLYAIGVESYHTWIQGDGGVKLYDQTSEILVANSSGVTSNYFIGDGSLLSNITGANVTGTVPLAQYVTANAQGNITSVGTLTSLSVNGNIDAGNISLTGNIDGSNLNIANNAVILGNLTVNGNTTFFNSNVVTINDKFINLANNASTPGAANGGGIGIGPIASEYATLTYNSTANIWETNIGFGINGNVTAVNFIGNGAALTNITGANVTGVVPLAQYVTGNAQGNITSVGVLTSLSSTGNITGANINGNGSGLSSLTGANVTGVVPLAQYVTQAAQGNITSVGVLTSLSSTGNITGANVIGNVYTNSVIGIVANGNIDIVPDGTGHLNINADTLRVGDNNQPAVIASRGTGNLTLQAHEGDTAQSNVRIVEGANGNVEINLNGTGSLNAARISVSGNITSGNIVNNGTVSSTGNITAPYFIGNVSGNIFGNIDAAGSNTQVQFNDTGDILGASAGFTFDKTSNALAVSGNITGGNITSLGSVTAAGNIGSTQQTIIGTANATASATGNIVISGKNIATDVVFAPDASTTTTPTGGRILIGAGVAGNTLLTAWDNNNFLRGTRVALMDSYTKNNSSVVSGALKSWQAVSLDGNITSVTSRVQGIGAVLNISGGAAGNSISISPSAGQQGLINAVTGVVNIGGANPNLISQIGANITTNHATGISSVMQTYGAGTSVGNLVTYYSTMLTNNTTSNIRNAIGYSIQTGDNAGATTGVGNTIGYLFPDYLPTYGGSVGGSFTKGNLYAFLNAGNVAQMRLGSIREQHYYTYLPATTGSITIDATNGMYQSITPTGNITITDFLNFVTSGFNVGLATNIPQYQEVTLAITQGATPYTVTLPTTVASTGFPVQYENNFSSVNATAYGMTYITIKSQPIGVTGGFPWYVSVRQGGTGAAQGAAGANTWVQFNDGNTLGANVNFNYNKNTNLLSVGNVNVVDSTSGAWGGLNAGNISTVGSTSLLYSAGNITAVNTVSANTIKDNGAGSITFSTANVQTGGNIIASQQVYGNIVTAGAYVSTPALYTSDITPPSAGPLQTTTSLSTITGNLSVTGNITGGNITTTGISRLGSIQSYNQSQYSLPGSGSGISIDKQNGQVQYLRPTGSVTFSGFSNFVTSQGGVNQSDTVTLIVSQGSTPYSVTLPTGTNIKYAGNLSTIGTTANSVTMVSITGANVASSTMYLVTVSPEFV